MKKRILITMMCCAMIFGGHIGCGKNTQVCDFCEEEKTCQTKNVFGEEVYICDDCLDELYN